MIRIAREVFVSLTRLHAILISGWVLAVIAVVSVRLALGTPPTTAENLAIGVLACIPIIVLVVVFRGAPSRSIAQVLYDADQRERTGVRKAHATESGEVRQ
jgi:hypothetical protein